MVIDLKKSLSGVQNLQISQKLKSIKWTMEKLASSSSHLVEKGQTRRFHFLLCSKKEQS